ncbi:MAG TPA: phage portal protein [Stellaceae bacterium]|nr:phage portal protein [Stellaceae bacterium]
MPDSFFARLARGAGYVLTGSAPADWFGPQQPLPPQAPPAVAGRQFDYPFGFNLAVTPRSWEPTGFAELRALADSYDLLRAVIETRKDQMERLTWRIRPRALVPASSTNDPRLPALTQFFHRPDRQHGWAAWLRMLLEDLLVIDAPVLYKQRTRGGALYALEPIDGATIKRLIDDWGRTPAPPAPAYQQILKGLPAVDYTADELIYAPRNPRIHKAYGFSPVEQVQMSVNIALRRQIYQLQYYTEGNVPEALIGVPENWNPDQIRQFQAYWDSLNAGDTAERRHAKFVPGGVAKTFVPVREPAMKDAFDEWLARVVCYAFSLPPTAFTAQVNRATAENAQDVALSEGLAPLQNWVKHLIDRVIAEELGASDLEFAWDADADADPAATATIATDYVKTGIKSINEVRAELGLPPVAGGEQPKIQTAQGLVPLTQSAASAPTSEKLERFNPNHYGPGGRGGQFAPTDGNGAASSPIVPVALDPKKIITLGMAIARWLQRAKKPPSESPTPEEAGQSESRSPPSNDANSAPEKPESPTANGNQSDDQKPPPPDQPFTLPAQQPKGRSVPFHTGQDVVDTIENALDNDWHQFLDGVGRVVDTTSWMKD